MDLRSVVCPISGVEYRCIHGDRANDVRYLEQWVSRLQARFRNKEHVSIAVDCEGKFLGELPDSGLTIQLGEVFGGGYCIGQDTRPPPVAPKPGVIVFFPITKKVRSLLQVIFGSAYVKLITLDFTGDIAAILEAGISVRYKSIIDCQMATAADYPDQLRNVKVSGMARLIDEAPPDTDPLIRRAKGLGKSKRNWDAVFYVMVAENRSPYTMVDRGFLEYAASDITLTGLVCASVIRQNQMQECIRRTRQKVEQFQECLQEFDHPIYPSLQRKYAFFKMRDLKGYGKLPPQIQTIEDVEHALVSWRYAYTFVTLESKLRIVMNIPKKDHAILKATKKLLNPYMPTIKELAGL